MSDAIGGGRAAAFLALWNGIDPGRDDEYNQWHALEHVPQRLTVPGMLRGRRYVARDDLTYPYFTLYDLASSEVLASAEYEALLTDPTEWSRSMRPSFREMLRIPCRDVAVRAFGSGGALMTLELNDVGAIDPAAWQSAVVELAGLQGVIAARAGIEVMELAGLPWREGDSAPARRAVRGVVLQQGQEPALLHGQHPSVMRCLAMCGPPAQMTVRHYTLMSLHDC